MTKQNIPNLLTFFRVLAVPAALVIVVFFPLLTGLLFWLFVAASLTDFFDGYLARKWNATSQLGALLDPMADKLLVAVVLFFLIALHPQTVLLPASIILLRELYIAGLREFLALRSIPLPVSKGGKWKTALQMLAIAVLLAQLNWPVPNGWNVGILLLCASALLALSSAIGYTRKAWVHLK